MSTILLRRCLVQAASRRIPATPLNHKFLLHSYPSLTSSSILTPHLRTMSTVSFAARQRIQQLRELADSSPNDLKLQYQVLKESNRIGDHEYVIDRVEGQQFASNASCKFEYQKAIQALQQQHQQQQQQQQYDPYQQPQPSHATSAPSHPYSTPHNHYAYPSSSSAHAPPSTPGFNPSIPGSLPSNPLILHEVTPRVNWGDSFFYAIPRVLLFCAVFGGYMWWTDRQKKTKKDDSSSVSSIFSNPFGPPKDFLNREMSTIRFADVKGCDEAKAELQEVVEFLKNPTKFERLGGKMTKGILLTGPPGTGKTLLAKAVAGEAGVPFFSASGSEFDEMYVGVGAKRVRELFAAARKQKRAIIFIDEIDAVGGNRDRIGSSMGRATINALLTEMDGFAENSGVIVIGATNLGQTLDPALVRPGRFDRRVVVSLPDAQGRFEILAHYAKKMKLHPEVDLRLLSKSTVGMSGAELNNLLNTAAIRASAQGKSSIDHDEIEYAFDKIVMGAERSFTQSPAVKASTAYHEAGHTIMLLNTPGAAPLHKVTILPRGRALGAMFYLPKNEHSILTREELLAAIDVSMGGRVAEEILNGPEGITSGASNDLEQATQRARRMVTEFGMGDKTGVFTLPRMNDNRVNPAQVVAPETLQLIDEEVARILKTSYERAKKVILSHRAEWERLGQALIDHEVLDAAQVMQAVKGEVVTRKVVNKYRPQMGDDSAGTPPPPPASDSGMKQPKQPIAAAAEVKA